MRKAGKNLHKGELNTLPAYLGQLRVKEEHDPVLHRQVPLRAGAGLPAPEAWSTGALRVVHALDQLLREQLAESATQRVLPVRVTLHVGREVKPKLLLRESHKGARVDPVGRRCLQQPTKPVHQVAASAVRPMHPDGRDEFAKPFQPDHGADLQERVPVRFQPCPPGNQLGNS